LASQQLAGTATSDRLHGHHANPDQALRDLHSRIQDTEDTGRAIEQRWKRVERRIWILAGSLLLMSCAKRQRMKRRRS
jgi:hypothetical protein